MSKLEIEEIVIDSDDFENNNMFNDDLLVMRREEIKKPNTDRNICILITNVIFLIIASSYILTFTINCNTYMNTISIKINVVNINKKIIDYSTLLYEINFIYNDTKFKEYYVCDLYSNNNDNKCLKKYDYFKINFDVYMRIYYGYDLFIFNNPNRCPAMILSYLPLFIIIISIISHIIIYKKGLENRCRLFKYTKKLILAELLSLLFFSILIRTINIFL